MNFLALDLGSSTGYCFNVSSRRYSGTWKLATAKELNDQKRTRMDRRGDIRVSRFFAKIMALQSSSQFSAIVWEDVQFSKHTLATQLWASFRTAIWLAFPGPQPVKECVGVTALKKLSTGNGAADKDGMARALVAKESHLWNLCGKVGALKVVEKATGRLLTNDEVDAILLWIWTNIALGRMPENER